MNMKNIKINQLFLALSISLIVSCGEQNESKVENTNKSETIIQPKRELAKNQIKIEKNFASTASVTIKQGDVTEDYNFVVSPVSENACRIHDGFTMLTIMDSRNWVLGVSFEGAQKGIFKLNSTYSQPNIVTVNVGRGEYMPSLEKGTLEITEFTKDDWISGKFNGVSGKNKDLQVHGTFTIQAKR